MGANVPKPTLRPGDQFKRIRVSTHVRVNKKQAVSSAVKVQPLFAELGQLFCKKVGSNLLPIALLKPVSILEPATNQNLVVHAQLL